MNKKVVVIDCEDCQFHEGHYANGKLMDQTCHKLGIQIHRNINMDFAENCPLEDDTSEIQKKRIVDKVIMEMPNDTDNK